MTQWRANTQPLQSLQFNARNNSNQLERRSNTKHNVMIKAILICKSVSQLRKSRKHMAYMEQPVKIHTPYDSSTSCNSMLHIVSCVLRTLHLASTLVTPFNKNPAIRTQMKFPFCILRKTQENKRMARTLGSPNAEYIWVRKKCERARDRRGE